MPKLKKLTKGNKKILQLIGLFFLVFAVIAGLYLVRQNQNIEEDAAGGCRSYNSDKTTCEASCGGAKKDGSTYKCRFGKNGCVETSKKCTGGGGGGIAGSLCSKFENGVCRAGQGDCLGYISIPSSDCTGTTPVCCTGIPITVNPPCDPGSKKYVRCISTLPGYNCNIKAEEQVCSNGTWVTSGVKCKCTPEAL